MNTRPDEIGRRKNWSKVIGSFTYVSQFQPYDIMNMDIAKCEFDIRRSINGSTYFL